MAELVGGHGHALQIFLAHPLLGSLAQRCATTSSIGDKAVSCAPWPRLSIIFALVFVCSVASREACSSRGSIGRHAFASKMLHHPVILLCGGGQVDILRCAHRSSQASAPMAAHRDQASSRTACGHLSRSCIYTAGTRAQHAMPCSTPNAPRTAPSRRGLLDGGPEAALVRS